MKSHASGVTVIYIGAAAGLIVVAMIVIATIASLKRYITRGNAM